MSNYTPQQIEEFLREFFDVVGTRQYVGARYVPLFGRKGESSIAWDNTKPYEPLTIVLHQGSSYTSRTYVPSGVEITDTYYWAKTGDYDAQIEQYRQEVVNLEEDFAQLQSDLDGWKSDTEEELNEGLAKHDIPANLNVLCIGDSWGEGYGASGIGWPKEIENMGIFETVTNNSVGGYSFNQPEHSFIRLLETAFSTQDERDEIQRLIIVGGANAASSSGFYADVVACVTRAKQLYPNALIYVGANGPNHHNKWRDENTRQIVNGAIDSGACPIEGLDKTCSFSLGWTTDNWHLTDYENVAKTIVSCVLGDTCVITPYKDFAYSSVEINTDLFPNAHYTYFLGAQYGTKVLLFITIDFGAVSEDITIPSRTPIKIATVKERNIVYTGESNIISNKYLKPDTKEGTFEGSFVYYVVPTRLTGELNSYYGVYPSFCLFWTGTQPTTIAASAISGKTLSFELAWDLSEPFPKTKDALYWYQHLVAES